MVEAVFISWDDASQAGIAHSSDGQAYLLRYRDGQTFYISDDQPTPMLTGQHEQPAGYRLKVPEIGDPVLVCPPPDSHTRTYWGYLHHYLETVERRYGSSFVTANK